MFGRFLIITTLPTETKAEETQVEGLAAGGYRLRAVDGMPEKILIRAASDLCLPLELQADAERRGLTSGVYTDITGSPRENVGTK
jgi:hypothetical protein